MKWKRSSIAFAFGLLVATQASAQDGGFGIELNDVVDIEAGCRLVYVAVNQTGVVLERTSYDVFTFDASGRVSKSLVFQFGGFAPGKTKVVQFDLPDQACGDISRLLINDTRECQVGGNASSICIDALKTSSRTPIVFGL